jgi:hypothetical protein
MLREELVSVNDGLLSSRREKGCMWMIGAEIFMSERALKMKSKSSTGPNFISFEVGEMKTFANVMVHLLLLGVLCGKEALVRAYSRSFNWFGVRLQLMFECGVGV